VRRGEECCLTSGLRSERSWRRRFLGVTTIGLGVGGGGIASLGATADAARPLAFNERADWRSRRRPSRQLSVLDVVSERDGATHPHAPVPRGRELVADALDDDRGNIMSPTYSVRRGNRYRYYISSALLHDRRGAAGSLARVNADDVERLVVEVLGRELSRPELSTDSPSAGWSAETRTLVRDTVELVVVQRDQVQIVRKPAATSATGAPDGEGDVPQVYAAPLPAPRPRARKEIIVPGGRDSTPRRLNHALILAIARAKSWMRDLRKGKYANTMEIARRFQLSDAHVRRILRFGYLAPDIVEAIVEGRQPRSLTVKRLLQGIPCVWADQRAAFDFAR
jgi:site-specific DNA recombinase